MREVFQLKNNEWVSVMFACNYCDIIFKTEKYCSKHEDKCKTINSKKKLKEQWDMPVQRIYKDGETFYRWGDQGKLYKNMADAEAQGRAAYAAGYRESTQTKDRKAEAAGRKVTADLEYDMGHNPADDAKAERAGRRVAKNIEYDMKRKSR